MGGWGGRVTLRNSESYLKQDAHTHAHILTYDMSGAKHFQPFKKDNGPLI